MRALVEGGQVPGAAKVNGLLRLRRFDRGADLAAQAGPDLAYLDRAAISALSQAVTGTGWRSGSPSTSIP